MNMDLYEINDRRSKKDFSRITFSCYKRTEVEKLFIKAILDSNVEEANYWCAEYIAIAEFDKLWELFYMLACKHIHISNPKLLPYLHLKHEQYETIRSMGYKDYEIALRNNKNIRVLFCEIVCVLCYSPKMPMVAPIKLRNKDLEIINLHSRLKAPNTHYGNTYLYDNDPNEMLLSINEMAFLCSDEYLNDTGTHEHAITKFYDVLYWLHWIIAYDEHCRKVNIPLQCATRQPSDNTLVHSLKEDVIWIVWDIIDDCAYNHPNKLVHRIIKSILYFYKMKFTHACKKRKLPLLYYAFQLLFLHTDPSIQLISFEDKQKMDIVKKNINIIYGMLKENEQSIETDYLFNNLDATVKTREDTQKRLQMMDSMTMP